MKQKLEGSIRSELAKTVEKRKSAKEQFKLSHILAGLSSRLQEWLNSNLKLKKNTVAHVYSCLRMVVSNVTQEFLSINGCI